MISALLSLFLFVSTASAQSICYTPSDCAFPQHCSSLDDGLSPGICIPLPKEEKEEVELPPTPAYVEEVIEEPTTEVDEEKVEENGEVVEEEKDEGEEDATPTVVEDVIDEKESDDEDEVEDDSFFGFMEETLFDPVGNFFETIWCTFFCE